MRDKIDWGDLLIQSERTKFAEGYCYGLITGLCIMFFACVAVFPRFVLKG